MMQKYANCLTMKKYIVIVLFILACSGEGEKGISENASSIEQQIDNARVTFTENGEKVAILTSDVILRYFDNDTTYGRRINVDFFRNDTLVSTLTADSGWVRERSEEIGVFGNVVVISLEDSATLKTTSLFYNPRKRIIYTNEHCRIERGGEFVEGDRLVSDVQFNNIQMRENIRGRL